jgi:hypothetical protein
MQFCDYTNFFVGFIFSIENLDIAIEKRGNIGLCFDVSLVLQRAQG